MDIIWTVVSFLLTLLILSFIFGDNPLFRFAAYLFVGVSAGYAAVLLIYQVLWPQLVVPIVAGDWITAVPLALGLLLVFRLVPSLSRIGNISMAYLVGAAAAVAIGGAVLGTLLSQTRGAINAFDSGASANGAAPLGGLGDALVMLVGTVATLAYFQFTARTRPNQPPKRPAAVETLARIGQIFIAVTLGALFAGVMAAALTALIERLGFIQTTLTTYLLSRRHDHITCRCRICISSRPRLANYPRRPV